MFRNAIDLVDVFGFRIRVDPSWLLIAALIVWSLSTAYFPEFLPGYSRYDYIGLAFVAMLGLFGSLILHELSHSLVARRFGLKVGGITLFIFGGVAELEQEPKSPKSEFWIAVAGPAMSFALAGFFYLLASWLQEMNGSASIQSIFGYLGFINMVLALFNLAPAFPLDGGRVLRAVLWHFQKDLFRATRIASRFGTWFGIFLIVSGILALFSSMSVGGLWQILIGFFVVTASQSSYQQLVIKAALKDQNVRTLMSRSPWVVDADDTIQSLVDNIMLRMNVSFVPVTEGNHILGYVDTAIVQGIDRENWPSTTVGDVFVAANGENTVSPSVAVDELFEKMARGGKRKLLVVENGELLGVISLADLMSYLAIRQGLGLPEQGRRENPNSGEQIPSGT